MLKTKEAIRGHWSYDLSPLIGITLIYVVCSGLAGAVDSQVKYTIDCRHEHDQTYSQKLIANGTACADFSVNPLLNFSPMQSWIWAQVSLKAKCSAQDDKLCRQSPVLLIIQPRGTWVAPAHARWQQAASPGEWVTTGSPGQAPGGADSACSKQAVFAMQCPASRENEHKGEYSISDISALNRAEPGGGRGRQKSTLENNILIQFICSVAWVKATGNNVLAAWA